MNTFSENKAQAAAQWEDAKDALTKKAAVRHIPLSGTFELTPRCNLRCKMCYIRLDRQRMSLLGRELTAEEWIHLARKAADAGMLYLTVTGGEPLLRDDFVEIYTALTRMGFILTLNTNACLINDPVYEVLKRYPPTNVLVTIYGAGPETYGKICGDPEAFPRAMQGLERLSGISTRLEVRTTFIKDNRKELEQIRTLANRYTDRFSINTEVFKPIRGAVSEAERCRLTPRQAISLSEANFKYYEKSGRADPLSSHDPVQPGERLPPEILRCYAAKSIFWITWDGKMLPCGSFSEPYTLPFSEGFQQAWDRLPSLLKDASRPDECARCTIPRDLCKSCPANLQSETGSLSKRSAYICAMAKLRYGKVKKRKNKY